MEEPQATTIDKQRVQFMLFVNHYSKGDQQAQLIRQALSELGGDDCFGLQVVHISSQPSLVEYFRLVAIPALVKTEPLPTQVLTGTDLVQQLRYWWPRWQIALQEESLPQFNDKRLPSEGVIGPEGVMLPAGISRQVFQLSDEVFRLKQESEALEEQLKFRDRVIAILAHDLRTPLTTASLAIETLEKGLKQSQQWLAAADVPAPSGGAIPNHSPLSDEMMLRLADQARSQLRKLDRMMDDILQAAQGEADQLSIQPEKLNLQRLCHDIMLQLRDRLSAKSLHMDADIPTDLPPVCADAERIRQVLNNLFDNAIKYTPAGGRLSLACLHRTSQTVQISLCDTGPGIPPEAEETIFDDAFRLPRDQQTSGYGIGLSLCRRIICAHYGRIWVSPRSPHGSCFHFTLPVYF